MLTNTHRWSHTRGNTVVPYRWQATGCVSQIVRGFVRDLFHCRARSSHDRVAGTPAT